MEAQMEQPNSNRVYSSPSSQICKDRMEKMKNIINTDSNEAIYDVPFSKLSKQNLKTDSKKQNTLEEAYHFPSSKPCKNDLSQSKKQIYDVPSNNPTAKGKAEIELPSQYHSHSSKVVYDVPSKESNLSSLRKILKKLPIDLYEDASYNVSTNKFCISDTVCQEDLYQEANEFPHQNYCNNASPTRMVEQSHIVKSADSDTTFTTDEDDVIYSSPDLLSSFLVKEANANVVEEVESVQGTKDNISQELSDLPTGSGENLQKPDEDKSKKPQPNFVVSTNVQLPKESQGKQSSYSDDGRQDKVKSVEGVKLSDITEHIESSKCHHYTKEYFVKKAIRSRSSKKGIKSSIEKLLVRKHKTNLRDPNPIYEFRKSGIYPSEDYQNFYEKKRLVEETITNEIPFTSWKKQTVIAWLELWISLPAWLISFCRENVYSGAMMVNLTDEDLRKELGVSNPFHRLKLRLAIREIDNLTSQTSKKPLDMSFARGSMDHYWVANEWLPSLGLGQYRAQFLSCLIDGRMVEHLTKKDLKQHFKMTNAFHRASLSFGIQCLKRLNFNRKELEDRRNECYNEAKDLLVWSNQRLIRWLEGIGLKEYAGNLSGNGVHGAILILDCDFHADNLAGSMQIPIENVEARELLSRELSNIKSTAKSKSTCSAKPPPLISDKWEIYDRPLPSLPPDDGTSDKNANLRKQRCGYRYDVVWSNEEAF